MEEDPTDSESESEPEESGSDADGALNTGSDAPGTKRKCSGRKTKAKKQAKNVNYIILNCIPSTD